MGALRDEPPHSTRQVRSGLRRPHKCETFSTPSDQVAVSVCDGRRDAAIRHNEDTFHHTPGRRSLHGPALRSIHDSRDDRRGDSRRQRPTAGLRKTAEVLFAAGAKRVHPFRLGLAGIDRPEDIEAGLPMTLKARDLFQYASHPMGTCRMGGSLDSSVVDPTGRVWGWDNLRVADASIFPTSLGVNPQVTTMAMALMIGHERMA